MKRNKPATPAGRKAAPPAAKKPATSAKPASTSAAKKPGQPAAAQVALAEAFRQQTSELKRVRAGFETLREDNATLRAEKDRLDEQLAQDRLQFKRRVEAEAKKLAADAIKGAVVGLHVTADGGACVAELGALAKRVNGGEKAAAAYAAASAAEVSHMCAVYFEAKDTGTEMGP